MKLRYCDIRINPDWASSMMVELCIRFLKSAMSKKHNRRRNLGAAYRAFRKATWWHFRERDEERVVLLNKRSNMEKLRKEHEAKIK